MTAILTLDEVLDVATRMLRSSGASPLQTDATARSIRDAEADGIRTVGLSYLPTYCDHVACGKVVGDAVPIVARPRPATVVVDAGNGFCHPAFEAGNSVSMRSRRGPEKSSIRSTRSSRRGSTITRNSIPSRSESAC